MKIERTKNTKRNTLWGIVEKIITMLLPFVTRTVLLYLLGSQYLGLNSLFSSILQVLNLADLGIGIAIVYSMYKPIAEDDEDAICALLALYRNLFRIIGCVILVIGLALVPFLRNFIDGEIPSDVNIYVVYLIYLGNTVISYFLFAYKRSLLNAHQRNDVVTKVRTALIVLQYAMQIGLLFIVRNYYLYLLVLPFITLLNNIITAIATKKMFPNLECRGKVSKETKKEIKKQVGGICIGKICGTTRNSLDSIFISMFWGLTQVAIYSNYFYIMNAIHALLSVVTTSMMGGVGNSLVKESIEKNFQDFKKMTFLYSWIAGWCSCTLLCTYQPFMRIWVGEENMFPFWTMAVFCMYLYSLSAIDIKNVYVTASGLWWENRLRAILEFSVNLVLNFLLGMLWGAIGVLVATLITIIVINFAYGSSILFKHLFKDESLKLHYLRHIAYAAVVAVVTAVTYFVCSLLPDEGFIYLLVKFAICIVLPNALLFLIYFRTETFKTSIPMIKSILRRG